MNSATSPAPRVAITGASGLLGRALTPHLLARGYDVVPVSRRAMPNGIRWDPASGQLEATAFEGLYGVIHLAGENIAEGRWSAARKRALRESRIGPTRLLAETLAGLASPPSVLISASAVGIYGDQGDQLLTEESPAAADFLGKLGSEWESAADAARAAGIRVVHPRLGIVLSQEGGALAKMLPSARLGLGGPLGDGRQWMSWIAIDDVLEIFTRMLTDDALIGAINVVAPEPVLNAEFAATLGRVLGRPAVLPVPAIALRLLFGEMADAALLASTRVLPTRLSVSGYTYSHPTLAPALHHLLAAVPRTGAS